MPVFEVTFHNLEVQKVDDGWLAEKELEATFAFWVNNQQKKWKKDIKKGSYDIGISFIVNVASYLPDTQIVIGVSGTEEDDLFDDVLPRTILYWGEADGWGEGVHFIDAKNDEITYWLSYSIHATYERLGLISTQALLAYAQATANKRGIRTPTDREALVWSMNRASKSGWEVVQMKDDEILFKGTGPFLKLVEERFGESSYQSTGKSKYVT